MTLKSLDVVSLWGTGCIDLEGIDDTIRYTRYT